MAKQNKTDKQSASRKGGSNKSDLKDPPKGGKKNAASPSKQRATVATTTTTTKSQPPFPLYSNLSNATVSEGFESVVNLLKGRKNIVVLTGAGISVSCGIPDFRSKGSGLYSTLDTEALGLTCPEDLFDWEVFQEDPRPFFKFARNLYFPLGTDDNAQRIRPSDSHKLLALLEQKKMLLRVYSQNIDGLEEVAGVSPKKMVYAHGSLQWATCCKCKSKVAAKDIEAAILQRMVPLCNSPVKESKKIPAAPSQRQPTRGRKRPRPTADEFQPVGDPNSCNGVLKPGVTFFGEALQDNVRKCLESDRNKVDALIVIGTSLSVAPMSKVIGYLPSNIPRILINRTIVQPKNSHVESEDSDCESDEEEKEFREGYVFDSCLLGYCDDVTRVLAKRLFTTPDDDSAEESQEEQPETPCELLMTLQQKCAELEEPKASNTAALGDSDADADSVPDPDMFKAEDWNNCKVPQERVFLFPGAQAVKGSGYGDDEDEDGNSEVTFREVAHCDGCTKRIVGTIQKCSNCFDFDLCQRCFPKLSKKHYNGSHVFSAEPAAPFEED